MVFADLIKSARERKCPFVSRCPTMTPMTDILNSYKLAEKLQDRLNELNKDLTEMIEEINRTSQDLSKTGKPDDPVSLYCMSRR
jgi:hypothetical protein